MSDTPRTDAAEKQNTHRYNAVKQSGWNFARTLERENAAMREELASLRAWKAEQLLVESQWDVQEIGKLLNLPLGADIRPSIQPAIESMREAIKEASLQVSAFLGFYSDSLSLPQMRSLSECINKLQPFLTESKQHEQTKHQH